MAFTRKIKEYYVLVHTLRKGKRVVQRTKYLGKKLPGKKELARITKQFMAEIMEGRYKYLSLDDAKQIEEKKQKYTDDQQKLSSLEKSNNFEEFMIRFTYDSSKLAGVDVTLRQTYLILKDGIIPKGFKNLATIKELENHEKGVVAITKYNGSLDIKFIKKLHSLLLSGVDDTIAGKFRSELKRNVKIGGTTFIPPKWDHVEKEIDGFIKWYRSENRKLHPVVLAALVHLKLITMQPFVDGNSRLARLLMNWVLWKKGYPLVDIKIEELEDYYSVLDKYQIENQERPFVRYVVEKFMGM